MEIQTPVRPLTNSEDIKQLKKEISDLKTEFRIFKQSRPSYSEKTESKLPKKTNINSSKLKEPNKSKLETSNLKNKSPSTNNSSKMSNIEAQNQKENSKLLNSYTPLNNKLASSTLSTSTNILPPPPPPMNTIKNSSSPKIQTSKKPVKPLPPCPKDKLNTTQRNFKKYSNSNIENCGSKKPLRPLPPCPKDKLNTDPSSTLSKTDELVKKSQSLRKVSPKKNKNSPHFTQDIITFALHKKFQNVIRSPQPNTPTTGNDLSFSNSPSVWID